MDFNEIQNTWKNSFRRKKPLDRGQIETLLKIRKNSNSALNKIKKSYKKLAKEFHPDTIISKGLPDEFIDFATKRFQEIQEAYEQIRKVRGF